MEYLTIDYQCDELPQMVNGEFTGISTAFQQKFIPREKIIAYKECSSTTDECSRIYVSNYCRCLVLSGFSAKYIEFDTWLGVDQIQQLLSLHVPCIATNHETIIYNVVTYVSCLCVNTTSTYKKYIVYLVVCIITCIILGICLVCMQLLA